MSPQHRTISLFGQPIFTWITMKTPSQGAIQLPSEACFAYILDGDSQCLLHEEDIKAIPGKVILSLCGYTMSNMISKYEAEEGVVSTIVVHFQRDILKRIYENEKPPGWKELDAPVTKYIVQDAATELVKQYFHGIAHMFDNSQAANEDILILKLKEIILLLLQTKSSNQVLQIMKSLFSERTFSFKEIIEAHVCEPVSVETLAALTNCSVTSFKKEFKKIYNTTPGAYITEKRTEKVARLLSYSEESISNIGYQCGFTSPAHLSRVFKSKYGVPPSEYRAGNIEIGK